MSSARLPPPILVTAVLTAAFAPTPRAQGPCEVLQVDAPETSASSWFGNSVALQGEVLVIGEQFGGPSLPHPGSARVLERDAGRGVWAHAATLFASDPSGHTDEFGYSVATDGQTVLVGAPDMGDFGAKGAAYVFERQGDGAWVETAKLVPPSGVWAFGWSCDVEGDRIVVGAKGVAAFNDGGHVVVFQRSGGWWNQTQVIQPGLTIGGDGFGNSLDLEGERLVVGASYGWLGACVPFCEGRAFVYEKHPTGSLLVLKAILAPDDLGDWDYFGEDVALHGDRIVVGAPQHDLPQPHGGAVYVFDQVDGVWVQTAKLTPKALPMFTMFGMAVDVEGGRVVIGAPADQGGGPDGGATYLFEQESEAWVEAAKFYGSELQPGDASGFAVDMEGTEVVVGAPHIAGEPGPHGKVYLFDLELDAPSLISDGSVVSLTAGGTQSFQLGACASHSGDIYVFAGSASGTSPGFALGGLDVPLNLDAYFLLTAKKPGAPPFVAGLGVFDAFGRAEAKFHLPPGILQPALAGVELHHAYAVLDGSTLQLEAVSAAVPVSLVP